MVRWQVLGQKSLESSGALFARLALLVVGPGLVVEVARAFNVGILKRVGPGAELSGAAFGQAYEI